MSSMRNTSSNDNEHQNVLSGLHSQQRGHNMMIPPQQLQLQQPRSQSQQQYHQSSSSFANRELNSHSNQFNRSMMNSSIQNGSMNPYNTGGIATQPQAQEAARTHYYDMNTLQMNNNNINNNTINNNNINGSSLQTRPMFYPLQVDETNRIDQTQKQQQNQESSRQIGRREQQILSSQSQLSQQQHQRSMYNNHNTSQDSIGNTPTLQTTEHHEHSGGTIDEPSLPLSRCSSFGSMLDWDISIGVSPLVTPKLTQIQKLNMNLATQQQQASASTNIFQHVSSLPLNSSSNVIDTNNNPPSFVIPNNSSYPNITNTYNSISNVGNMNTTNNNNNNKNNHNVPPSFTSPTNYSTPSSTFTGNHLKTVGNLTKAPSITLEKKDDGTSSNNNNNNISQWIQNHKKSSQQSNKSTGETESKLEKRSLLMMMMNKNIVPETVPTRLQDEHYNHFTKPMRSNNTSRSTSTGSCISIKSNPSTDTSSLSETSLLHNTCKLFPQSLMVIESALQFDPDAIRTAIPTLCSMNHSSTNQNGSIDTSSNSHQDDQMKPATAIRNYYSYPLNIAIQYNASIDVINFLINSCPDIVTKLDGPNQTGSLSIALSSMKEDTPTTTTTNHNNNNNNNPQGNTNTLSRMDELVRIFITANPDCVKVLDRRKNTILHYMARRRGDVSCDIISLVYQLYPQALHARNCLGQTPVQVAQRNPTITDNLLDHWYNLSYREQEMKLEKSLLQIDNEINDIDSSFSDKYANFNYCRPKRNFYGDDTSPGSGGGGCSSGGGTCSSSNDAGCNDPNTNNNCDSGAPRKAIKASNASPYFVPSVLPPRNKDTTSSQGKIDHDKK